MAEDSRRPLNRGFVQEFDLRQSLTESQVRETAAISKKLQSLLPDENSEQSGHDLDELLYSLGDSYVEDGRVRWNAPPDLDPVLADYFSRSVEALNKRIGDGDIKIDENGDIRPANL
ncbi:hypothetical protein [Mesorhizobium sp.]|uniref:hypothetical protein n=1 Tax=Mesorhizobium sp. TaxID=1871066 RepID=UPI000FE8D66C|nr:hypothetical protein [Mesorhizobium sp.]RWP37431.1 MAG: hypothetical protein EOR03_05000 [Mesorhizobium sp.]